MGEVKISAIMPVYNVEKFVGKCIESLQKQTFSDFELIAVDDGSPDRSGEICEEYAAKDPRIKVIHQKNAGAPAARNAASPSGAISNSRYVASPSSACSRGE